jgi:hypothetical protein
MPIMSDAAPLLLMAEGVADADELVCAVLAAALVTGVTVDAVPGVPMLLEGVSEHCLSNR